MRLDWTIDRLWRLAYEKCQLTSRLEIVNSTICIIILLNRKLNPNKCIDVKSKFSFLTLLFSINTTRLLTFVFIIYIYTEQRR